MQCTSNIPPYHHSRDLNVGAIGFAWHLSNSNGEERGHNVFIPPSHVDWYLGYNKEVLRQTIQNHEATFRYQVQELHRLYRRQNEMTNDIRMGEIITPNLQSNYLLSGSMCEISQTKQHTTSWMRGDCYDSKLSGLTSESIQQPSILVAKNFQEPAPLWRKDINHEIQALPYKNRGHDMRILNLEHPVNVSEAFEAQNASNSEHVSIKTGDLSSFNISSRKWNFLIDLNEPIQLDEPASIFIPHSETHEKSEVTNCDTRSFAIDLNSVPKNEIDGKFLKIDTTFIDLDADVNAEPSLPLSNTNIETKEKELEAPVSPENKEGSPPRGKSEEILELSAELDETAAESLIMISSFGGSNNVKSAITEMAGDFFNSLCWFAEVASSSIGDDLENEHIELVSDATDNDEDENCETLSRIIAKEKKRRGRSTQHKLQKESLASMGLTSKLVGTGEFRKSGSLMVKEGGKGKKRCAKQRKCLMLSSLNSVKKHGNRKGVLQGWGMMKKRTARKYLVAECRL